MQKVSKNNIISDAQSCIKSTEYCTLLLHTLKMNVQIMHFMD